MSQYPGLHFFFFKSITMIRQKMAVNWLKTQTMKASIHHCLVTQIEVLYPTQGWSHGATDIWTHTKYVRKCLLATNLRLQRVLHPVHFN